MKKSAKQTILLKKLNAHRLYVKLLYTAAECSRRVKITPKTMCTWIKEGNWNEEREKELNAAISKGEPPMVPEIILGDFGHYMEQMSPHLAKQVQPLINEYLKLSYNHQLN